MSDIEGRLGGESRTLRTVRALQARSIPDTEFSLVIGADLRGRDRRWYGAEELRRLVPFIVVGREAASTAAPAVTMPAISSSEVRERLRQGQPVDRAGAAHSARLHPRKKAIREVAEP